MKKDKLMLKPIVVLVFVFGLFNGLVLSADTAYARVSLSQLQADIEALQNDVVALQNQIDIEKNRIDGHFGQSCPSGKAVTGIDGSGLIICESYSSAVAGCGDAAEFGMEITPGLWACVNNVNITTYNENFSMCAENSTPATYNLVNALGLRKPTTAEHNAFFSWYKGLATSGDTNYIRTGQKRRGGCTLEAHGDLYVYNMSVDDNGGSWGDLFNGGSSCNNRTNAANNMNHKLAGVICVLGEYEDPAP